MSALRGFVCLLNTYSGAVTAIATVFMAIFTYVLIRVSSRQARLISDQVRLGREEFNATHRPEISILSLEPIHEATEDEKVAVQVMYVNKGRSVARKILVEAHISQRPLPLQSNISLGGRPGATNVVKPDLKSGMKDYFLVESEILSRSAVVQGMAESRGQGVSSIVCIGRISYYDGLEGRRETGFCRIYDSRSERWGPIDNAEYEYCY